VAVFFVRSESSRDLSDFPEKNKNFEQKLSLACLSSLFFLFFIEKSTGALPVHLVFVHFLEPA